MPFRLGPIPLRVTEGEFNIALAVAFAPMIINILCGLILGDNPIFIPYTLIIAIILALLGAVFFGLIKKGRPDSYLYDWVQSTALLAGLARPQRGMIPGGRRIIAAAQPMVIAHPWGGGAVGRFDAGPKTTEELIFPADGRGGSLPQFVRHPALATTIAIAVTEVS